jgi:hypothetical protein
MRRERSGGAGHPAIRRRDPLDAVSTLDGGLNRLDGDPLDGDPAGSTLDGGTLDAIRSTRSRHPLAIRPSGDPAIRRAQPRSARRDPARRPLDGDPANRAKDGGPVRPAVPRPAVFKPSARWSR